MAPEVLLGKEVGAKADVYSYGLGKSLFLRISNFSTFHFSFMGNYYWRRFIS